MTTRIVIEELWRGEGKRLSIQNPTIDDAVGYPIPFTRGLDKWVEKINARPHSLSPHANFQSCWYDCDDDSMSRHKRIAVDTCGAVSTLLILETFFISGYPWIDLGLGHFITVINHPTTKLAIYFNSSFFEMKKLVQTNEFPYCFPIEKERFLPGLIFVYDYFAYLDRRKPYCLPVHTFCIDADDENNEVIFSVLKQFSHTSAELSLFNLCRNQLLLMLCKDGTQSKQHIVWARENLPPTISYTLIPVLEFITLFPDFADFLIYFISQVFFPSQVFDLWQKKGQSYFTKHG